MFQHSYLVKKVTKYLEIQHKICTLASYSLEIAIDLFHDPEGEQILPNSL